ncbi:hypothetical protein GOBAR_AA09652 [Gossypium barbadense]|uniref:Uncharacterized protein n=1 Tax=Gossypium barbadense TaxID=3634 RepID=A0A2P5Y605_GOSBA|nr:hypothetical protein GOBAR_AA09652 [Gossypium barbadense]
MAVGNIDLNHQTTSTNYDPDVLELPRVWKKRTKEHTAVRCGCARHIAWVHGRMRYWLKFHEKHRLGTRHTSVDQRRVAQQEACTTKGPGATSSSATTEICHPFIQFLPGPQEDLFQILCTRPLGVGQCISWAALDQLQMVMSEFDDPGTVQFRLGGLMCQLSVPEFDDGFSPTVGAYDPHRSKGFICTGPYVTRLARHFRLLNTLAQSLSLTLIGQMSPQDISIMLHIRMIECHRGFDPLQYRLARATDQDDPDDITEDIPSFHENPPS